MYWLLHNSWKSEILGGIFEVVEYDLLIQIYFPLGSGGSVKIDILIVNDRCRQDRPIVCILYESSETHTNSISMFLRSNTTIYLIHTIPVIF